MRLTRQLAIDLSIELWTWLADTGGEKEDWPGWEKKGGKHTEFLSDCFLCEYSRDQEGYLNCDSCPYHARYGFCDEDSEPYIKWNEATTVEDSQLYAKECLEKLKQLKEGQ